MSIEDSEGLELLVLGASIDVNSNEYVDLYRVNLEAGQVTKFGCNALYGADDLSYMVALGDMIYVLGGCPEYLKKNKKNKPGNVRPVHSKVSRINIVDFKCGWKKVNHYKARNDISLPFACFKNKIYLFGGRISNKDGTYTKSPGEVYDPALNYWALLPEPEVPESQRVSYNFDHVSPPVLVDTKNNRMIVQLNYAGSAYAYYPDKRKWVRLAHCFRLSSDIITTLFDDMIIRHVRKATSYFQVFDLVANKWVHPILSPDFDTHLLRYEYQALFPMGSTGIFCLCTWSPVRVNPNNKQLLIFVKFRVKRIHCGDPLFNFISYHKIEVDEPCCWFTNSFPIVIGGKMSKTKDTSEEASSPLGDSRLIDERLIWTDDMEEALLGSLIEQIKLGNRIGGTFTTTAYDNVCKKLKKLFPHTNMTVSKITNHLKNMTY